MRSFPIRDLVFLCAGALASLACGGPSADRDGTDVEAPVQETSEPHCTASEGSPPKVALGWDGGGLPGQTPVLVLDNHSDEPLEVHPELVIDVGSVRRRVVLEATELLPRAEKRLPIVIPIFENPQSPVGSVLAHATLRSLSTVIAGEGAVAQERVASTALRVALAREGYGAVLEPAAAATALAQRLQALGIKLAEDQDLARAGVGDGSEMHGEEVQ